MERKFQFDFSDCLMLCLNSGWFFGIFAGAALLGTLGFIFKRKTEMEQGFGYSTLPQ
jgi:hypothetical protein